MLEMKGRKIIPRMMCTVVANVAKYDRSRIHVGLLERVHVELHTRFELVLKSATAGIEDRKAQAAPWFVGQTDCPEAIGCMTSALPVGPFRQLGTRFRRIGLVVNKN
jgi:hypothetical protein